ncbi:ABC transporter permease, partial [Leucobacter sp. M11]|uniref:ABC transporter permease n=1 Tax=Leucobacter sp. M11 TaxID=2993565 RepID=UPI002D8012CE
RAQYGLDRPLGEQFLAYLGRILSGDFGDSYAQKKPVTAVIGAGLWPTLLLAGVSLGVAWLIALGSTLLATGRSRAGRALSNGLDLTAASLPGFWLASMLILVFSSWLGWLPPVSTGGWSGLVLPVLALAVPVAGFLAQVMREGALDALDAPFVTSARARGEGELGVRARHVLRHGAVPALNLSGWALGSLISGAAVIETVFARPGLGRTLVTAVLGRDVPVVLGIVLFIALVYVLLTLLVDLAIARVDPRTEASLARA